MFETCKSATRLIQPGRQLRQVQQPTATQGCNNIALHCRPRAMAGRDTSGSRSSPLDVLGPWQRTPGHDAASYGNPLDTNTSTAVPPSEWSGDSAAGPIAGFTLPRHRWAIATLRAVARAYRGYRPDTLRPDGDVRRRRRAQEGSATPLTTPTTLSMMGFCAPPRPLCGWRPCDNDWVLAQTVAVPLAAGGRAGIRYDRGTMQFLCLILICLLCWYPTIYHFSIPILLLIYCSLILSTCYLVHEFCSRLLCLAYHLLFVALMWYHYIMILLSHYYDNLRLWIYYYIIVLLCYYYVTMLLCYYVTMLLCYYVTMLLCDYVATLLCYYVTTKTLHYCFTKLFHDLYD